MHSSADLVLFMSYTFLWHIFSSKMLLLHGSIRPPVGFETSSYKMSSASAHAMMSTSSLVLVL